MDPANWSVKLLVQAYVLSAALPAVLTTGAAGALGAELAAILPIQGVAGFGTYEAGRRRQCCPRASHRPTDLKGALALHLFVIASAVIAGSIAWLFPTHGPGPQQTTESTSSMTQSMTKSPPPPASPEIPADLPPHRLSLVVPMYNEAENVEPFARARPCRARRLPFPWEIPLVDDGSSDSTPAESERCATAYGPHVRIIELVRNFKQTAAMQAGLDAARGDVIVTMDGDLQNDPIDIPRMVNRLLKEDLTWWPAGARTGRMDCCCARSPRIANRLIARMTGVHLKDYGCSLKVFRGSAIKNVKLYGEMHRFIPAWLATVTTPRRIAQEVVTHHARVFGESKYGISRTFRVVLDLLFRGTSSCAFRTRPGHFFGGIGIGLGAIGVLILTYLMGVKLFLGESIGTRPLLFGGFFMVIAGIQMVTSGVLAELHPRALRVRRIAGLSGTWSRTAG